MAVDSTPLDIQIENFRSIRKTTLSLRPGVNILIGPNGSGKTCLLTALKFLRDILEQGAGLAMAKNGGPFRNYHRGESVIRFSVDHAYGRRIYNRIRRQFRFSWTISLAQSGPEQIATVIKEDLQIYVPSGEGRLNILTYSVDRTRSNQPSITYKLGSRSAIGRDVFLAPYEAEPRESKDKIYSKQDEFLGRVATELKRSGDISLLPYLARKNETIFSFVGRFINLNEYNILPDAARQGTDQLPFAEITPTGAGLSEVVHALKNKHYHRLGSSRTYESGRFARIDYSPRIVPPYASFRRFRPKDVDTILERINSELSLAVKSITGISTDIDPTNGKRFVVFESGSQRFYPEEISDGTIKWLSILISVFVPHSSIYLLEEPENFLHPWMQQQLIRLMREQNDHNEVIYVLTTHSATVLNAARLEEITAVLKGDEGTKTERLEEREMIADTLEKSDFGLGDLWVSGILGAVPSGEE